jgi:hypothetical protein
MLLHLPIAIMVTLSPIAVSSSVPQFDIVGECRFEGGSIATFDRCSQDEAAALFRAQDEMGKVRQYRSENLHGRDDDRRSRELRRTIDLPGNGTRRCERKQ